MLNELKKLDEQFKTSSQFRLPHFYINGNEEQKFAGPLSEAAMFTVEKGVVFSLELIKKNICHFFT